MGLGTRPIVYRDYEFMFGNFRFGHYKTCDSGSEQKLETKVYSHYNPEVVYKCQLAEGNDLKNSF